MWTWQPKKRGSEYEAQQLGSGDFTTAEIIRDRPLHHAGIQQEARWTSGRRTVLSKSSPSPQPRWTAIEGPKNKLSPHYFHNWAELCGRPRDETKCQLHSRLLTRTHRTDRRDQWHEKLKATIAICQQVIKASMGLATNSERPSGLGNKSFSLKAFYTLLCFMFFLFLLLFFFFFLPFVFFFSFLLSLSLLNVEENSSHRKLSPP